MCGTESSRHPMNEERVADLIGGAAAAILVLVVRVLEVVPLGVIECAHRNTVG